jgi:hypothetical protein
MRFTANSNAASARAYVETALDRYEYVFASVDLRIRRYRSKLDCEILEVSPNPLAN